MFVSLGGSHTNIWGKCELWLLPIVFMLQAPNLKVLLSIPRSTSAGKFRLLTSSENFGCAVIGVMNKILTKVMKHYSAKASAH